MTVHVPGVENVMADIAPRPSKVQQLFRSTSALSDINSAHRLTPHSHCPATSSGRSQAEIQRLRDAAWEAICGLCQDAPGEIQAHHILTDRLLTFAVAVREGQYGKGHKVQVQSVEFALRAVAQKYVLDGHPDPRRASPIQQALHLPIARLQKKYGDEDPPTKQ